MKKRFLSLLLALVMLIGLVPTALIPAFATEESEEQPKVDSKGYILIWSYEQLVSVAQNARSNENYRLATDIYQTDNSNDLGILVRCDSLSLDLNGHVLSRETRSLDSALFFVCDGSTLNIYDTSPDSTGTCIYNNNYVSDTCSVINNSGGNVIINGGNYIVKMYNPSFKASVLYGTSGEFTVYDGYFDSTQASNGNAVNMHYSNSLYDEPNCTIYGGRFYSQRTCIEARSLANYSDVYYPYVFVLGGEFYTKRSNGDEYEGNFAYCNNGWGRVIAANGLVPARSLNARDQRYATGTTTTVETLTGEPGNGWKYATVTPPPRIVSEQLPKEDRWYSLCWRDYLKAAKENESYDFWTANQEAIEAELAKIDGFSVNIFDTEVTLSIEDKKEIDSVRWYVSASPYSGWTELVDYQNITGPVTQDPPKPGKTLYYRAVVTRKGGTEYEDIIYVNCEEPTEDVTPAFTTQPTGGTVGYNERHTVNWATNFDAVKQELVRYSSAGSVVQIQGLDAGAFQASLSYMASGYYYRIRAYYNNSSYIESDKFYVTTDPYFTPNYEHGNTEGDIIEGITYVPNGDGTFNANVHVDLSYVDGQMLQHEWYGTGYYWYDHNNKLTYGIGTTDTDKLVFTLYNVGKNLVPGEEWRVKAYLAYDPYCDDEWREVDFPYVTNTVPEFKAHTCADSNNDHLCDTCGEIHSYCADLDKDHKCDTCGADVSECIDSNGDYKCDICGKDLGTPAPTGVTRLAGANRWATSLMVADEMKANLGVEKFDAIIVASGNDFADALAGSYLSTVKNAPILLGWGKGGKYVTLDEANIAYIKANLAANGTVYILGGKNAVPELYENELKGYNVKRLGGANRFETNLLILEEAGVADGSEILVCTSTNFADSLSASATAKPILLVFNEYGKLYGKQPEFLAGLKNCTFTVIGGENAVSAKLADAIKAYGAVTRLAGANRFETSVLVAQKYFDEPTTAVLAYAWNYPDGLCGGSLAYSLKAPLILTMTKYEAKAVEYAKAAGITSGIVLGGDSLISNAAVRAIFAMAAEDTIVVKK